MAGFCGCFSAAFAKWTAMAGIELRKLDIRIVADIDLTTGFGIEDGIDAVNDYKLEIFVESDASMDELNKVLEQTKKRCFCMYCITTSIMPKIDMIVEIPEEKIEEAVFICPTCFNKTMVFLDDNTQKCTNCGTTGYFTSQPDTKKVSQK